MKRRVEAQDEKPKKAPSAKSMKAAKPAKVEVPPLTLLNRTPCFTRSLT